MSYMDLYNEWLENDIIAESDKAELRAITDEKEIEDRFYKELDFGTGGLRGVLGMGTNRMNVYTVGKATQGLANYINKKNGAGKGVAIAYDSRRMSPEFASKAANCLNANGIKTYIFPCLTPTPELSFALKRIQEQSQVLLLQPATIHLNITDIRFTGRMVLRLHLQSMEILLLK